MSLSNCFEQSTWVSHVGENVGACTHCCGEAFWLAEFLHAPHHGVDDAGVGVDVPTVAHGVAKQILNEGAVVGKRNLFELRGRVLPQLLIELVGGVVHWPCVVRHDRGAASVDSCLERRQMVLAQRIFGWVLIGLTPVEVRIVAVEAHAATWEVLNGGRHGILGQLRALQTTHNSSDVIRDQLRILTKSTVEAGPTRLRSEVSHVTVQLVHTTGTPFLSSLGTESLHQFSIAKRSKTQLARPLREHTRGLIHTELRNERDVVTRIRRKHNRNTQTGTLRDFLNSIGPSSKLTSWQVVTNN